MDGLHRAQTRRRLLLAGSLMVMSVLLLFTRSYWNGSGYVHTLIAGLGIVAIVACIVGRVWCWLYISGRASSEVVSEGPYSVVRNPLYLFSIIGAAGIGAVVGSIVVAAVFGLVCYLVFRATALAEEQHLIVRHGQVYLDYMAKVPQFLPDLQAWRDVETVVVRPRSVVVAFFHSSLFLLAVPALKAVEWLQETGYLAALVVLP